MDCLLHYSAQKGGLSRVDQPEVQLVYAIKNKIKIDWPRYVISQMFDLKTSGRGAALGYASLIQSIRNKSNISVLGTTFVALSADQEFTQKSLSMIGHIWDPKHKKYMYYMRGNYVQLQNKSDEEHEDENEDENDYEEEDEREEMEEEAHAPQGPSDELVAMLESMCLQQQESASLTNERILTLWNQVCIHNEQFDAFTALQDRRYSTLHAIITLHSAKFDSFTSTFMHHYPLHQPHQDQGDVNQEK